MFTTAKREKLLTRYSLEQDYENIAKVVRYKNESQLTSRVVVLCFMTFYFGYCLAYLSTMSQSLLSGPFGPMMLDQRIIGPCMGIIPLGACVGTMLAQIAMGSLSRKTYLITLNVINIVITGLLQIPNLTVLFVFRFFQGVLVGNYMTLIPEYISELCPKEIASKYQVYPQISVVLGVLVAYVLGVIYHVSGVPDQVIWRIQLIFPQIPILIQLGLLAAGYIPQSPVSLITRERREEARQVLALFNEEKYVDAIIQQKENQIFNTKTLYEEDQVEVSTKSYLLGFQLSVYQSFSGIASMVTQAGHVISFYNKTVGLYTPIVITIAQLIGTFISILFLKHFQWKNVTIVGGFALTICDIGIAVSFYFWASQAWDNAMIVSMVFVSLFMLTFGLTFGSSVWPYITYLMPAQGVQAALVVNWFCSGLTIICFSLATYYMNTTPWIIMFVYCGITFILTVINTIVMVPIKGLSFKKVQLKMI